MFAGAVAEADEDRALSLAGYTGLGFNAPKKLYEIREGVAKQREIDRAGEYGTDMDRVVRFFQEAGHNVRIQDG